MSHLSCLSVLLDVLSVLTPPLGELGVDVHEQREQLVRLVEARLVPV